MNINIKDWYCETYPKDPCRLLLDPSATFKDLFHALDTYKDVYSVIGDVDSVVRERVFAKLAEIMEVDYDYIYDQWLRGENL